MKKLFSVFLASLLLLQLSLFALADSSKSAAAAQQYSLQVIDNVMQFVKNDKVVRSVSLQNSTINLGKSKQGGIRVSVKDSTGKSRSFTLGSQTALTVSGELQSLQLSKSLPASASVSLEKGAKVESLKVNAACKVQLPGQGQPAEGDQCKRQGDCGKIRFHRLGVHRFRKRAQRYFPGKNHRQHSRLALCRS